VRGRPGEVIKVSPGWEEWAAGRNAAGRARAGRSNQGFARRPLEFLGCEEWEWEWECGAGLCFRAGRHG